MNRRIRIEPEAEAELEGAAVWYETQQDGLGLLLLQQAASAYERIASGDHGTPVPRRICPRTAATGILADAGAVLLSCSELIAPFAAHKLIRLGGRPAPSH